MGGSILSSLNSSLNGRVFNEQQRNEKKAGASAEK